MNEDKPDFTTGEWKFPIPRSSFRTYFIYKDPAVRLMALVALMFALANAITAFALFERGHWVIAFAPTILGTFCAAIVYFTAIDKDG